MMCPSQALFVFLLCIPAVFGGPSLERSGRSGKFAICPTGDCNDRSIGVQVDFIRERDSAGKKITHHFKESMASTTFTVGAVENVYMGEPLVSASKYPFSTTIAVGKPSSATNAVLQLDTYFFQNKTQVRSENSTTVVDISQDAMKFDIRVSNWVFAQETNSLEVGIKLITNGASKEDGTLAPKDGGKAIDFGNMYFKTPLAAMYDNQEKAVDVRATTSGKSKVVTFTFESFTNEVVYDPTFGGTATESSGSTKALPALTGVLGFLACIIIAEIGF